MMDKARAEAIARTRAQIAERIARFCKDLSREDFDALLDRMAGIHYKYEYPEALPPKKRGPPPAATGPG